MIGTAFQHVLTVLRELGSDGQAQANLMLGATFQLTEKWGEHRPEHTVFAQSCLLEEFQRGIETKLRIGLHSDTFQRDYVLDDALAVAYAAGQYAARLNYMVEQRFLWRIFGTKGPLKTDATKAAILAATDARDAMLTRA